MKRNHHSFLNRSISRFLLLSFLLVTLVGWTQNEMKEKMIIAHRGASGYLPEHTLESKALAYGMGADYIEQDLVLSKDDIPVVIHDIHLEEVTNVKIVYPERKREDGRYYVIDFTFEELLRLRVNERINRKTGEVVYPERFPAGSSSFSLHSLQQEIELIKGLNKSTGKIVGIYPEIKNPGFHREEGKDISSIVLDVLKEYGYSDLSDTCILQCFDRWELRRIRVELGSRLFLTQLLEDRSELDDIEAFAAYANAIGPHYSLLLGGIDLKGNLTSNNAVKRAHSLGLKVHPYTYRKDSHPGFDSLEELLKVSFDELEVDGVFTDFPDLVGNYLNR